jgi:ubiquinone/menaquinone biosynthesis C-methylase UbiE
VTPTPDGTPDVAKPSRAARVEGFWDARAAQYDGHYDAVGSDGYALRARLALTLRLIGVGRGAVLDVGMGPGRLCEALAGEGWIVSGVDMSEEMVTRARDRLPDARERLLRASVEQLPFPDHSFDVVAATGVLEYTHLPHALEEVSRVVRPGGVAVVSYPNPAALYALWKTRIWYRVVPFVKRLLRRSHMQAPKGGASLSPDSFLRALETADLRVESIHYTNYLLLPSPLEEMFPRVTERLGAKLEGSGERIGRLLATQVLFVSTKPRAGEAPVNDADRSDGRRG